MVDNIGEVISEYQTTSLELKVKREIYFVGIFSLKILILHLKLGGELDSLLNLIKFEHVLCAYFCTTDSIARCKKKDKYFFAHTRLT